MKRKDTEGETKPKPASQASSAINQTTKVQISPAEQLQKSYEQHLRSLNQESKTTSGECRHDNALSPNRTVDIAGLRSTKDLVATSVEDLKEMELGEKAETNLKNEFMATNERKKDCTETTTTPTNNSSAEEEAGTILLGFLNSLRRSYEDAVDVTEQEKTTESQGGVAISSKSDGKGNSVPGETSPLRQEPKKEGVQVAEHGKISRRERGRKQRSLIGISSPNSLRGASIQMSERRAPFRNTHPSSRSGRPASVTDTSTLSRSETSSGASNPTESSSSLEDSDSKSDKTDGSSSEEESKGPPRKRLKSRKFTKRNLMEHSIRLKQASDESMETSDGF